MVRVVLHRLIISVPLVFIVSVLTFILQSLIPGDPARSILGSTGTPQAYTRLRTEMHLNDPLYLQWWRYIEGVFKGDFGTSLFTGEPVLHTLATRTPVTCSLLLGATVLCTLVGVCMGVASALRGGVTSKVIDVVSLAGLALPNYWLALLLVSALAIAVPVFPAIGYVPLGTSPLHWAQSLVLPVAALSLGGVAQIAKMTRDGMSDAMEQDYIRTLRASGVSPRSLIWKHGLKNAGVPISTMVGLVFIGALSGSLFVESVFVIPGLGSLVVTATTTHDIPVIQGVALAFTLIVVAANLVIDLTYSWLNPKVRTS